MAFSVSYSEFLKQSYFFGPTQNIVQFEMLHIFYSWKIWKPLNRSETLRDLRDVQTLA